MKRPIFYFAELTAWDKISLGIYPIISALIFLIVFDDLSSKSSENLVVNYTLVTQVFLVLGNYRSLRNFLVYLIWVLYALGHLFFYLSINISHHSNLYILRNTVFVLIAYQVIRVINLNIQHQEYIIPNRYGRDRYDNRPPNVLDFLTFFLLIGSIIGPMAWR
ncbi:hypothetical protein D0C36_06205 [Mucilaginibacter conchicola]|uniref:Uncharacterized protein n=1 Tax=Mucilaginibacter conchicola TaxID=2303333 RepID=A0A372P051_9SPHI|nr:hypothetical protein [Mucilaginibacter conchicola]RFZ95117.1 hypothetical protein D0C36_06205 [Mucilaginibacter conchicola]